MKSLSAYLNLKEQKTFLRDTNILVLSDEIYSELTYGRKHVSIAEIDGMWERTIYVSGFSKAFAMTGWRLGWVCGNKDIVQRLGKGKSTIDNGIFKALQKACAYILNSEAGDKYIEQGNMNYKHKQAIMVKGFKALGWPDVLEKSGVVLVPGNAFGAHGEGFFRLSYVCSDAQLQEVIDRFKADGFYYDR